LNNVEKANELIQSNLFRPPYGRIKQSQSRLLIKKGYKIVMWTILSADYDKNIAKEVCSGRVTDTIGNGMIYLFHDSEKAEERMGYALEKLLQTASSKGFTFRKLDSISKNS
jgi:peptidoglycan/xylan/chitin deacetylase (PgdA/CDA1 family)